LPVNYAAGGTEGLLQRNPLLVSTSSIPKLYRNHSGARMFAICAQAIASYTADAWRSGGASSVSGKNAVSLEKAASSQEIRGLIGQRLKARYDPAEPIPDSFVDLLKRLAKRMDERKSVSR